MDVRTRYTETLACAAATIGGPARLAQFLNVSRGRLMRWLAGEEAPPSQRYSSTRSTSSPTALTPAPSGAGRALQS